MHPSDSIYDNNLITSITSNWNINSWQLQWFVLFTLAFFNLIENLDRYLISVSPGPYLDLKSYQYALLVGTVFSLCYSLGGLIFATLSDANIGLLLHTNKLLIVCLATIVFSIAFLTTSYSSKFAEFAIIRMIMGLAQSVVTPFALGIIDDLFPSQRKGLAYGIYNMGTYFAFSLSLSLGIYINDKLGWTAGYRIFGSIGLVVGLVYPLLCFFGICNHSFLHSRNLDNSTSNSVGYSLHGLLNTNDSSTEVEEVSFVSQIYKIISEILNCWIHRPVVWFVLLATSCRLGSGYIWSAYTSVFFSELLSYDNSRLTSCSSSYNTEYSSNTLNMCDMRFPYCDINSRRCFKVNDEPWHNIGLSHHILETHMSWVAIAGSAMGNFIGGYFADLLHKKYSTSTSNNTIRLYFPFIGSFIALPLIISSFFLNSPYCFICLCISGFFGECYLSQSLIVINQESPKMYIVSSIALFYFCITLLGSNAPLLIPLVKNSELLQTLGLVDNNQIKLTIQALSPYGTVMNNDVIDDTTLFSIEHVNADLLQWTLVLVLASLYICSLLFYGMAILISSKDKTNIEELEVVESHNDIEITSISIDIDRSKYTTVVNTVVVMND